MASQRTTDWRTVALLGAMYAVLGGNAALYWIFPLHPLAHVLIGAAGIHLAFTVWHEAVHRSVSRKRWLNTLVGILGMFPYMSPYFMGRWVHLEHHRKLNTPEDPNLIYASGSFATLPFRYPRAIGYVRKVLAKDPRTPVERASDAAGLALIAAIYLFALWRGQLVGVLVVWFFPFVVAKVVMDWYINYLPHTGLPADKYGGTRIVDVAWLTPLVLSHNYHAIHHLWPHVPWHRYRAIFSEKIDMLRQHGVPIEHRVFARRPEPARLSDKDAVAS